MINFIVSLMSVFKMHHGAQEYGPEHARNARLGVVFKWTGTALSTLAAVLVVYLFLAGISTLVVAPGQTSVPVAIFVPLLVTAFWTGGVSCKGQMYRYMVRSLQPPETRRRSTFASALIPVLGIAGVVVVGYVTVRVVDAIRNPAAIDPFEVARLSQTLLGGVFLPPGLALIGYVIFLSVYLKTSERLTAGLAQVHAAMAPGPGWFGVPPASPYWPPPTPWQPTAPAAAGGSGSPGSAPMPPSTPGACPRCGRPAAADGVFCASCGARLES